jgi:flagellar biosynthesis chaperone FliJ
MSAKDRRLSRLIDLSARAVDAAHLSQANAQRRAEAAAGAKFAAENAFHEAVGEAPVGAVDPHDLEVEAARRGYLRMVAERRAREAEAARAQATKAMAALVEARIDHAKLEKFGQIRAERADEEARRQEAKSLDDLAARGARRSSDGGH